LGLFGNLLAQALTIHETIEISTAMVSSYNSGVHVWTERHGDQVRYCHKYAECLSRDRTTEIEHLAFAIALANCGYGRWARWQLTRIDLATDPIELSAYYPALAEVPVYFNQPHTALWCHQSVLSAPLRPLGVADHPGVDEDQQNCYARSGPAANPIGQLEQAIESILGHPDMSLQLAATIIGISPRTLQRRLAEDRTSFSRTLQAVRFRNARHLLQDPEMPTKEISQRLGYTDPANFMRAFKRWTGVSPNEFRRLHYIDV
jgi:AraC-like DNA-binding protein